MKNFSPALFASFIGACALALSAPRALANLTLSDTYAPHIGGNNVRIAVAADTVGSPYNEINGDYDVCGNYYTWGSSGLYAITGTLRNASTNQALGDRVLEMEGHPDDFNGPLDFDAFVAPGSYRIDVWTEAANFEDGHWYDDAFMDENGNWVSNGAAWTGGGTWSAGQIDSASISITVTQGGTTAQTITWTSPPPGQWAWNDTAPRTIAATASSGQPVTFVVLKLSQPTYSWYPSAALNLSGSNQLAPNGQPYVISQLVAVRARVAADATYAYTESDALVVMTKAPQTVSLNIPNMTNPYGLQGLNATGANTNPIFELISGGGWIEENGWSDTYHPDGYCGDVTIRVHCVSSDMYFESNYASRTFNVWAPPQAPGFAVNPISQTVAVGQSATFTVDAAGIPGPSYQWCKDGVPITGATSKTLTLSNVQGSDAGSYSAVATNSAGTATSGTATLTVQGAPPPALPVFTTQPQSQTIAAGGSVTFSATVTSSLTPVSYQWQKNGASIAGATNATLTLSNVQSADAGTYTLLAANSDGSVASNGAVLTVNAPPTPPAIITQPQSQSVTAGATVTFTATASGNPTPTYQWQKDGANIAGATNSALTLANVQSSDAGSYTLVATNSVGSATSSVASLTVTVSSGPDTAPVITLQPAAKIGDLGSTVQLHVEATGNPVPTFLWLKDGNPLPPDDNHFGETRNRLTLIGLKASDAGSYTVEVSNSVGSPVISNAATITVNTVSPIAINFAPVITEQPSNQYVTVGATPNLSTQATGIGRVKYRWFKNGAVVTGATNRALAFPAGGITSSDYGSYRVEASNDYGATSSQVVALGAPQAPAIADVSVPVVLGVPVILDLLAENPQASRPGPPTSWSFSSSATSNLTLNAAGLTLNTLTGRITGTPTQTGSVSGTYSAANDAGTSQAQLTINVLSASNPPVIISQPSGLTVGSGQPFDLVCSAATVATPLQFQWRKQGQALPGATLERLQIASTQSGDDGFYDVVVTNPNGSATSQAATVTLTTGGGTGSPPSAAFSFPLTVTKATVAANEYSIGEQASITKVVDALESSGTISATVGDKITIRFTAADVDGDLKVNMLKVIAPDVAGTGTTGNWNYAAERFWVDPNKSGPVDNPFVFAFPKDDLNRTNPVTREVSFVLDAAGVWKFRVQAIDETGKSATTSTKNSLDIQVRNPELSTNTAAIANAANRLVGAYFNAGQIHPSGLYFEDKWLASGKWTPIWGPNTVSPLIADWRSGNNPAKNILYQFYLGWASPGPITGLTTQDDSNTARSIAAELAYSGVDFVVIDHTNLVFTYGDRPAAGFTDIDNCVTRAATALVDGFRNYALGGNGVPASNVRVKITFMLGLTTAWFVDGMDGGHPSTELGIISNKWVYDQLRTYYDSNRDLDWSFILLSEFIERRSNRFNKLLQTIWDRYAKDPASWQYDPENGRPLLFLYVGPDGPAIHRSELDGTLNPDTAFNINHPLCLKVTTDPLPRGTGPTYRPIDQVFSIKYVAAGTASGYCYDAPLREGRTSVPFSARVSEMDTFGTGSDAVSRRYYFQHWSFREIGNTAEPVGTLRMTKNVAGDVITKTPDVVFVTAYRSNGPSYFTTDLDAAVKLKPRILMLAAWNEFGSTNDEPSPEESWTIMPNNKYGRKYSEILRTKVINYKGAP